MLVKSAIDGGQGRRRMIRETWAREKKIKGDSDEHHDDWTMGVFFVTGMSNKTRHNEALRRENNVHRVCCRCVVCTLR